MDGDVALLKHIYDRFNARDIDGVLAVLARALFPEASHPSALEGRLP